MSDMTRPTIQKQLIQGSRLDVSELGVIGSGKPGTKSVSKDIKTLQSHPDYKLGYFNITEAGKDSDLPFAQEFNSLRYIITYNLAYLQFGIPDWSDDMEYSKGAMVKFQGKIYIAKKNIQNYQDPTTDSWKEPDQITEMQEAVSALEPKILINLTRYVENQQNRVSYLQARVSRLVPVGRIYIQHIGETAGTWSSTPGSLFGGNWRIFRPFTSSTTGLRYESSALEFPNKKYKYSSVSAPSTSRRTVYGHDMSPKYNYQHSGYIAVTAPLDRDALEATEAALNSASRALRSAEVAYDAAYAAYYGSFTSEGTPGPLSALALEEFNRIYGEAIEEELERLREEFEISSAYRAAPGRRRARDTSLTSARQRLTSARQRLDSAKASYYYARAAYDAAREISYSNAYVEAYAHIWSTAFHAVPSTSSAISKRYATWVTNDLFQNAKNAELERTDNLYAATWYAAWRELFEYMTRTGIGLLGRGNSVLDKVIHETFDKIVTSYPTIPASNFNDTGQTIRLWIKTGD